MQPLDLYASIEEYLEFDDEIQTLYNAIASIAILKNPKTLIDIGCGQGEFCKLISSKGIKTFGVDLSAKQIEIAKSKNIDAKCIDIKDIKEKYDCATAVFDVVNYLPKDYIKSFLTHSYNLLNDDGYFIFDINSLYGFDEVAQGTLNIDNEDKFIAIDANYEDETLYTDITVFSKDGKCYKKESGTIEQYYYKIEELEKILESIGFKVEDVVDFKLHEYSQADDKFIFICKKEK
ncbi:MAG: methyltransferase domain-containing protein [Campylobacterota bacterium]|nr:methyltransferase domain-containing protein [Campylobacterota bacterium]